MEKVMQLQKEHSSKPPDCQGREKQGEPQRLSVPRETKASVWSWTDAFFHMDFGENQENTNNYWALLIMIGLHWTSPVHKRKNKQRLQVGGGGSLHSIYASLWKYK